MVYTRTDALIWETNVRIYDTSLKHSFFKPQYHLNRSDDPYMGVGIGFLHWMAWIYPGLGLAIRNALACAFMVIGEQNRGSVSRPL